LRTPVNHIVGYTELLGELAEERGLSHLETDLEKIRRAAEVWLTLMEDHLFAPAVPPPAIANPPEPGPGWEARVGSSLTGTLLVVDDDTTNCDMLTRRLLRLGHAVETADCGAQALQLLSPVT